MDLKHDWKALGEVLFQGQGAAAPGFALAAGGTRLVLLEDEGQALDGVASSGKAFLDFGADGLLSSKKSSMP